MVSAIERFHCTSVKGLDFFVCMALANKIGKPRRKKYIERHLPLLHLISLEAAIDQLIVIVAGLGERSLRDTRNNIGQCEIFTCKNSKAKRFFILPR